MNAVHPPAPLAALARAGVSIWLDELSRDRLRSGALAADVATRHVVGVTTNPSIFAKSVGGSAIYDEQIHDLAVRGVDVGEAVRMITSQDVREACDVLRPAFVASAGVDGKVSIEVDPRFARDTAATVAEAKQLWWLVDRPNVMIKIPATGEGLPAITQCIAAGISVNVTLIFSLERYAQVIDAYLTGLEQAHAAGIDLAGVHSVASFFISRVDSAVDAALGQGHPARGKTAIANARLAMEIHEQTLASARFISLADHGARPQRPLWASTSVKDPAYPDTLYVEQLVTAGVINTMPMATLEAVADHGPTPAEKWDTVRGTYAAARAALADVEAAGVELADITATLEEEGVASFVDAWDKLLAHVGATMTARKSEAG